MKVAVGRCPETGAALASQIESISLSVTSGRTPGRAPGNPVDGGRDDGTGDAAGTVDPCRAVDYSICLRGLDRHGPCECRDRESGELERSYEIPVHMFVPPIIHKDHI
jgi:hypothetical protein